MPLSETLARVDADLAACRVPLARQRLRGLVSSFPYDLTLRRRLAEVYRSTATPSRPDAGCTSRRTAAPTRPRPSRRATGHPGRRMKALAWRGPETMAASAFAEGQPASVRRACAAELGHPVDWDDAASYRDRPDGDAEEASEAWSVGGVLAGTGCLVGAVPFLAI
ncbi:DUF6584 family protein [Streptomyces sp. SAI-208]|uniref:DUF6584 family protein n=1 Tax=Streptomyces sp. SAI-208 TaxID=2940550 RepID=UPI0032AFA314